MKAVQTINNLSFLQPREERHYPPDNKNPFEEWFLDNYDLERNKSDRIYLPILTTELNKRIKRDRRLTRAVDEYFRHLDRSKKYFIIVQHDDGIMFNTWGIDLKVFGMGCKGDVQLPLVCQPHKYEFKETGRPIFASFIGSITHPIREEVLRIKRDDCFISTEHTSLHSYCYILSQSKFILCYRGYGLTSFRISEAFQFGATPVYISDKHLMPVGFNGDMILANNTKEALDLMLLSDYFDSELNKQTFQNHFTYEAVSNLIYEGLAEH